MHDDAPADDDDPIGQTVHVDDPVVLEYVPAAHDVHTDPSAEEYVPTAHGVHDDAPADGATDPIGQVLQKK